MARRRRKKRKITAWNRRFGATAKSCFSGAETMKGFGACMRRALKEAKPDRFEDLIALNALYRPGPMDMIPSFVERKHGREEF